MISFTNSFIRYFGLTIIMFLVTAVMLGSEGMEIEFLGLILLFNLKYLIYDGLTDVADRKIKKFSPDPWHIAGYSVAAIFDLFFIYSAHTGESDAGFALIFPVIFTPWILVFSLLFMLMSSALAGKK